MLACAFDLSDMLSSVTSTHFGVKPVASYIVYMMCNICRLHKHCFHALELSSACVRRKRCFSGVAGTYTPQRSYHVLYLWQVDAEPPALHIDVSTIPSDQMNHVQSTQHLSHV